MSKLRTVVIVSKDKSDLYFANQLMQRLNVIGVIVENQLAAPDNTSKLLKAFKLIIRPHILIHRVYDNIMERYRRRFADYYKSENSANFGEEGTRLFPTDNTETLYTKGVNNINAPEYAAWLDKIKPDVIAVCGASLLREKILSIPRYGVLNLHGGLSQRYRGLFTTDWAIHNEEPEYVGATVHFVTPGIDDGAIVYQGRPIIEPEDNPHSLYVKVVKLGVNMMTRAIHDIEEGKINPVQPLQKGKLCLGRMYDVKARARAWKNIRKRVIQKYLANKQARDIAPLQMMQNTFPDSR
jgi:methionyl-tRNA formyltransferase